VLLLATVALTGCRLAEHGRRAAIDAFASFVLDSVFQMQKAAPLTQGPGRAVAVTPLPKPHLRICRVRRIVVIAPDPATL